MMDKGEGEARSAEQETKRVIEAALFISGRWMTADDLVKVVGTGSVGLVKDTLASLKSEYDSRDGGIRMSESDGRYRLEIIPEVRDKVYYLAPEPELSPALIKTLALIAYKQPIYKSRVVEVIGNRAYGYIKELRKKEFITIKKKGRGNLLMTTGHFRKYFALEDGAQFRPELGPEAQALEEAQKRLDEMMKNEVLEDVSDEELDADEKRTKGKNKVLEEEKKSLDEETKGLDESKTDLEETREVLEEARGIKPNRRSDIQFEDGTTPGEGEV